VLNVLRTQLLAATDFHDPGAVLAGLNRAFPMERNNDKYFTIWYGVYHLSTRELTFASGGHHAAILLSEENQVQRLQSHGPVIGALPDLDFPSGRVVVPPGAELYLFSDGVYEIARPDGGWQSWEEFSDYLRAERPGLEAIVAHMRAIHGRDDFEDDFSLLKIKLR
jgi:sigma-B regulation protein RsbU (phosphoserine phosphatase)